MALETRAVVGVNRKKGDGELVGEGVAVSVGGISVDVSVGGIDVSVGGAVGSDVLVDVARSSGSMFCDW